MRTCIYGNLCCFDARKASQMMARVLQLQIQSKCLRPRQARLIRGPSGPTAVLTAEKPPITSASDSNGSGRRVMIIGKRLHRTCCDAPHAIVESRVLPQTTDRGSFHT